MTCDRGPTKELLLRWLLLVALVAVPVGCKSSSCDQELVGRAETFLKTHQSCSIDADCVVVGDFCETLPNGYCGQLTMSRQGRDSSDWASLSEELKDCAPSECTECLAALAPTCTNGSCNGP